MTLPPFDDQDAQSALLAGVPEEARRVIWRRLLEATEGLVTYWSETPPGNRVEMTPALQHTGHALFSPADLLGQPTANLRRLLAIEARLTGDAAEAFILFSVPSNGSSYSDVRAAPALKSVPANAKEINRFAPGYDHDPAAAWALLRDQCARLGQLYAEMKRRTWVGLALLLLDWELRILRYRYSSAVAPLLWGEAIVPAGALV